MELPKYIQSILTTLKKDGFEAYAVGGAVRDLLMGKEATDWDITTNAKPEEIQNIFPESFCENEFGTVTLKPQEKNPFHLRIEITPYRAEIGYSDKRHPDTVLFGVRLEEDLSRRDFTINAIAYDGEKIQDPFGGETDLQKKLIRTVGKSEDRFGEDALRLLRAIRFSTQLGFTIEEKTFAAIKKLASTIVHVSSERVRDEFSKMVLAPKPSIGFKQLRDTGLLALLFPELQEGVSCGQNKHHIYDVFEHNIYSLDFAAQYGYSFEVRLAALLHDSGKPRSKQGEGYDSTFHGHEHTGTLLAKQLLTRLTFPKKIIDKVKLLVRHHLFYYNVGEVTEASVRRLLKKVGPENIYELIQLRIAERKGSGVAKAKPYKLRHLEFMIDKVQRDPISAKMLAINGDYMIKEMGMKPGVRMGDLIEILLEEIIEDPQKNTRAYLEKRIRELDGASDEALKKLAENARAHVQGAEEEEIGEIKKKHYVT